LVEPIGFLTHTGKLADLRRDIETWLLPVLLPSNVPNEEIPKVTELPEMNQMLYETIQGLYKDAEARGEARGKAEGEARGEARGKSDGRIEGQAGMLIQLLETKFGPLKSYQKTKIQRFDSKTRSKCSQRLFTANSVGEVIGKKRSFFFDKLDFLHRLNPSFLVRYSFTKPKAT